ncbi:hypothetical protein ACFUEN_29285 [Streptomyces griseorubiginosus]|uniref:hypothetical protein n=1 Tax=Streptomyces griseorubiginosus TaxID=67304 RepID=UPI0036254688
MGILAAGAVGAVAATVRYALREFDARTRVQAREESERQRRHDLAMQKREIDLEMREQALARGRAAAAVRIASYMASLDEARNSNQALRVRISELETEIAEVNDERNQLIVEELVHAREQFTSKGYGRLRAVGGGQGNAPVALPRGRAASIGHPEPEQLRRIDTP